MSDPTAPDGMVLGSPPPVGTSAEDSRHGTGAALDGLAAPAKPSGALATRDLDAASLGSGPGSDGLARGVSRALVDGRYRSSGTEFVVELRVDVEGQRTLQCVSADFFAVSGSTVAYFGSMRVDAAQVTRSPELVTITGTGIYTFSTAAPKMRVVIARVADDEPNAPATLRFFSQAEQPGGVYECQFESPSFRTVLLEEDRQDGVTAFSAYDTGRLASGGDDRQLSVAAAYAEAGLEVQSSGQSSVMSATGNPSWSDAELHSAMQTNFAKFADVPQWAIWLLHAKVHDKGPGLFGAMFDQQDRHRQGCAVFYESMAGDDAENQRLQLFTCVHEIGHAFNMLHSWQKERGRPPELNRPLSLSWLNYPWRFPEPAEFWSRFAFQFDDLELRHLRHAFRDNVVMGANPFSVGSGLGRDTGWADPEQQDAGLRLSITAPRSVPYGVPVTVDLELRATTEQPRLVPTVLGPRPGTIDIAIRRPSGTSIVFAPLLQHCRGEEPETLLRAGDEPVRDSAFIHYGEQGFAFEQPGRYRLRARYIADDGSRVLSDIATLLVTNPVTQEDNDVSELAFGEEQGTLMSLLGSDDPTLRSGNDALMEIIERHGNHPVADAARVVLGTNAAREFKAVRSDGSVSVRPPTPSEATALLDPVFDIDRVRSSTATLQDPADMCRAAANELVEIGTKQGVGEAIDCFIRSRRNEVAVELSELV